MQTMKPQLAEDANLDEVRYPCMVQPKYDGVRALNLTGTLTGRSLDPFAGFGIAAYFNHTSFTGFDGEMVLGPDPLDTDRLCHKTSGAMGKFKGVREMADLHWHLFDYLIPATIKLPYVDRYQALSDRLKQLRHNHPRVHLVPNRFIENRRELDLAIKVWLVLGAEGVIIRNPQALPKEGRPTKSGQQLWRYKLWADAEMLVTEIIEGEANCNKATINSLGKSERSSAKAGKVPNGQIGSLRGPLLEDILHPITKELLLPQGTMVTVGSGEMSVDEATQWFRDQAQILNHIVTFKFMPHGMKDAPRMPTFKSKRLKVDMSRVKRRIR